MDSYPWMVKSVYMGPKDEDGLLYKDAFCKRTPSADLGWLCCTVKRFSCGPELYRPLKINTVISLFLAVEGSHKLGFFAQ